MALTTTSFRGLLSTAMGDLSRLLGNRLWTRSVAPFPYFRGENVFTSSAYAELAAAFGEVVARGYAEVPDGKRFCRSMSRYDAYAIGFSRSLPKPFHVFMSREFHDLIASVTGVRGTGDVDGGLHHHLVGSRNGWCHSDLNPGWFGRPVPPPTAINLSERRYCDYASGRTTVPTIRPRELVRGAAAIFFVGNDPWSPGDGGETGLYASRQSDVSLPDAAIPPIENSLLVFECTPYSFHSFISNRRRPRNSVILWIHRTKEDAVVRFGRHQIAGWNVRGRS